MLKRLMWVAGLAALLILAGVIERLNRGPAPVALIPTLTGETEYCLTCHSDLPEISAAHPVETFGCVLCHGGERLALEPDLAHSTLRGGGNPSDLAVAEASCGGSLCHSGETLQNRDHLQRVQASLHSTYAGAIAWARHQAGLQADLGASQAIVAVADLSDDRPPLAHGAALPGSLEAFNPAQPDQPTLAAFSANCLGCHLRSPADDQANRQTGCAACHSPANPDPGRPTHSLTTAIPSEQCRQCHARGAYDLERLEFTAIPQPPGSAHPSFAGETTCLAALDCIDCHTRLEVMGDGHLLNSMEDVRAISCATCHGAADRLPDVEQVVSPEHLALRLAFLNPGSDLAPGERIVLSEYGEPLWHMRQLDDGSISLTGKVSGQIRRVPLVRGSGCIQDPARQDAQDCFTCHRQPGMVTP